MSRIDAATQIERMAALYVAEPAQALRVPPQSAQAEAAVLGALMIAPKSLPIVQDLLAVEDFYRADHQAIYRAILSLSDARKPFDAVTVMDWFEANGGEVDGSYLVDLATTTPSAANVKAYAKIVADKALLRRMIEAGTGIIDAGFKPDGRDTEDLLADAQSAIVALQPRSRGGLKPAADSLMAWFDDLQRRYEADGRMVGMPYPWHEVNKHTHGMESGTLILLPARPSMGKSIGINNIGLFVAMRGHRVAQFSLEASAVQVHRRNISSLSNVPHDWLLAPDDNNEDYLPRTNAAAGLYKKAQHNLFIDDTADLTIGQLQARARMLHLQKPIELLLVDHIHDFKIKANEARFELGRIAQGLKTLAKEFKCPVIAAAQLNRGLSTRSDKRPTLSDLRESGELEQKADVVLFLHREDYYDKETHLKGVVEMIIAKGRDIEAGKTIHLKNDYAHMALRDWEGQLPSPPMRAKKTDRWGPQ